MRFTKKIVERGNITLPSDVREALGIEDGDFVEFDIVGILKKHDVVNLRDIANLPIKSPKDRMRTTAALRSTQSDVSPPKEGPQ